MAAPDSTRWNMSASAVVLLPIRMEGVVNALVAVASGALFLVGLCCVVGNYVMLVLPWGSRLRGTAKSYSLVPVVGPMI